MEGSSQAIHQDVRLDRGRARVAAIALASPSGAQVRPPLDGNPVSPGLGPTYGEEWCAPVGSENVQQAAPLALIPYGAIRCTLEQFEAEAAALGSRTG